MKPHRPSVPLAEPARVRGAVLSLCLLALTLPMAGEAAAGQCSVSLSQPQVDYGRLLRGELLGEQPGRHEVFLGTRLSQLNVVCPDAVPMVLRLDGVPAGTDGFRFGQSGSLRLRFKQARVDGQAVVLVQEQAGASVSAQLRPGVTVVAQSAGRPVTGRTLSAQIEIDTYLPSAATAVRSETRLEGGVRFELVSGG